MVRRYNLIKLREAEAMKGAEGILTNGEEWSPMDLKAPIKGIGKYHCII
jgi:hypothetical protein